MDYIVLQPFMSGSLIRKTTLKPCTCIYIWKLVIRGWQEHGIDYTEQISQTLWYPSTFWLITITAQTHSSLTSQSLSLTHVCVPCVLQRDKICGHHKNGNFSLSFFLDSSWGYFSVAAFSMSILKVWDSSWRLHFL